MDSKRFDALTKRLATGGTSRRRLLQGLGGGVLAALGGVSLAGAEPACRTAGHPCEGNQECCNQLICQASGPGAALRCTPCPTGTLVYQGACCLTANTCCPAPTISCAAQCCSGRVETGLLTCVGGAGYACAAGNCGAPCGSASDCGVGTICVGGTCTCPSGTCTNGHCTP